MNTAAGDETKGSLPRLQRLTWASLLPDSVGEESLNPMQARWDREAVCHRPMYISPLGRPAELRKPERLAVQRGLQGSGVCLARNRARKQHGSRQNAGANQFLFS